MNKALNISNYLKKQFDFISIKNEYEEALECTKKRSKSAANRSRIDTTLNKSGLKAHPCKFNFFKFLFKFIPKELVYSLIDAYETAPNKKKLIEEISEFRECIQAEYKQKLLEMLLFFIFSTKIWSSNQNNNNNNKRLNNNNNNINESCLLNNSNIDSSRDLIKDVFVAMGENNKKNNQQSSIMPNSNKKGKNISSTYKSSPMSEARAESKSLELTPKIKKNEFNSSPSTSIKKSSQKIKKDIFLITKSENKNNSSVLNTTSQNSASTSFAINSHSNKTNNFNFNNPQVNIPNSEFSKTNQFNQVYPNQMLNMNLPSNNYQGAFPANMMMPFNNYNNMFGYPMNPMMSNCIQANAMLNPASPMSKINQTGFNNPNVIPPHQHQKQQQQQMNVNRDENDFLTKNSPQIIINKNPHFQPENKLKIKLDSQSPHFYAESKSIIFTNKSGKDFNNKPPHSENNSKQKSDEKIIKNFKKEHQYLGNKKRREEEEEEEEKKDKLKKQGINLEINSKTSRMNTIPINIVNPVRKFIFSPSKEGKSEIFSQSKSNVNEVHVKVLNADEEDENEHKKIISQNQNVINNNIQYNEAYNNRTNMNEINQSFRVKEESSNMSTCSTATFANLNSQVSSLEEFAYNLKNVIKIFSENFTENSLKKLTMILGLEEEKVKLIQQYLIDRNYPKEKKEYILLYQTGLTGLFLKIDSINKKYSLIKKRIN